MDKVSVLITARNEKFLEKTILDVLANADEDIEILVNLDGYTPDPQIVINDNRVYFFHNKKPIGQRASLNKLAKKASGKYVMKLDAHCAVDKGFDRKLKADCEYDWTVIPRMYNLDVTTWQPKMIEDFSKAVKYGKVTDYMHMGINSKNELRAMYYSGSERKRLHKNDKEIDDVMCCMGPCFFMHKERFFELGACDEGHTGGWGQQGIEVSCKAWLSGGSLKVNKKTWFAHWFRGNEGFPYPMSQRTVNKVRKYSKDLWMNDKWSKATRTFKWLQDKFNMTDTQVLPKTAKIRKRLDKQHAHIKAAIFPMDELYPNLLNYRDQRRDIQRAQRRIETMPVFVKKVIAGQEFTEDELTKESYYDALVYTQKTSHRKAIELMRDLIQLVDSIKKEGVRNPIDVWKSRGELVIHRGWRRIVIMKELGYTHVPCRVYASMTVFRKHAANRYFQPDDTINGHAMKQYMKWQGKATDKYWLHQYTPLYDKHIGHRQDEAVKILEIGLLRGASLDLWRRAFPKAKLCGVDITDKWKELAPKDVTVFQGRQEDPELLKKVAENGPYDIIIDDAGHRPKEQQASFKFLWEHLNENGTYILEDLYGNYRSKYRKISTVNMLKGLIDVMNIDGYMRSMNFYYNICFIEKTIQG